MGINSPPVRPQSNAGVGVKIKYHLKGLKKITKEDRHKAMLALGASVKKINHYIIIPFQGLSHGNTRTRITDGDSGKKDN